MSHYTKFVVISKRSNESVWYEHKGFTVCRKCFCDFPTLHVFTETREWVWADILKTVANLSHVDEHVETFHLCHTCYDKDIQRCVKKGYIHKEPWLLLQETIKL